jgi:hypothetical protein
VAEYIQYDAEAVLAMLRKLPEELRDKAMAMAINKTAAKAKTEMKRQITAIYNLPSIEVGGALNVSQAKWKTQTTIYASMFPSTLGGRGRAMNVIRFLESKVTKTDIKTRTADGSLEELYFQFKKTGGKKTIGAEGGTSKPFLGNASRTVFRRLIGVPSATNPDKEAIESVQVIDVPQMFNVKTINRSVLEKAADDLLVEADRAVSYLLSGLK